MYVVPLVIPNIYMALPSHYRTIKGVYVYECLLFSKYNSERVCFCMCLCLHFPNYYVKKLLSHLQLYYFN